MLSPQSILTSWINWSTFHQDSTRSYPSIPGHSHVAHRLAPARHRQVFRRRVRLGSAGEDGRGWAGGCTSSDGLGSLGCVGMVGSCWRKTMYVFYQIYSDIVCVRICYGLRCGGRSFQGIFGAENLFGATIHLCIRGSEERTTFPKQLSLSHVCSKFVFILGQPIKSDRSNIYCSNLICVYYI